MLHVEASGGPERPTVVLLHGFLGSSADWSGFAAGCGDRYRFLAVDLPGHGQSAAADDAGNVSFEGALDALEHALARERAPACLVGYSMGGRLALGLALRRPALVSGLVLVSSSPGLVTPVERMQRAREDDALAERLAIGGLPRFLQDWYRQPLFQSLRDRPGLERTLRLRRAGGDARALARALRGLGVGRQLPLWTALPGLPVPVLAVAGALDTRYAEVLRRVAGLCPRGRLLIVPGAGHMPHLEHPEFFDIQVRRFLEQHAR